MGLKARQHPPEAVSAIGRSCLTKIPGSDFPEPHPTGDGAAASNGDPLDAIETAQLFRAAQEEAAPRRRAEAELDDFFENGTIALHWVGPDGTILRANRQELNMLGYKRDDYLGRNIAEFHVSRDASTDILSRLSAGETIDNYEAQLRCKDGSIRDVLISSSVRWDAGRFVHTRCFTTDITERKKAEETQRLLVGELTHRVKNTLATVQALATQTLHSISEPERNAFLARLRALGTAHEVLTQNGWNRAPVRSVIDRALQPFASDRITMRGPDAPLDASRSLMLTMALHELATNAGKYGALSNDSGRVSIEWTVVDAGSERSIQLHWQEQGGPPVRPPAHKSFGSRLIENSFEKAHIVYAPDGVACSIEIRI
jgi:PAS domain S-box-containing protein